MYNEINYQLRNYGFAGIGGRSIIIYIPTYIQVNKNELWTAGLLMTRLKWNLIDLHLIYGEPETPIF